jgi:phospholipase/carboxylesterase
MYDNRETLGGILGNSGFYFPFTVINNKTPIQILHGEDDEVIPI